MAQTFTEVETPFSKMSFTPDVPPAALAASQPALGVLSPDRPAVALGAPLAGRSRTGCRGLRRPDGGSVGHPGRDRDPRRRPSYPPLLGATPMNPERRQILDLLSQGKITADEAERLMAALEKDKEKILRVLLKADVNGTLEALQGCLEDIKSSKVRLEIVGGSVGPITQSDVQLAEAAKSIIVGFDTKLENGVQPMLKRTGVRIVTHDIIYELITLVKEAMAELLDPELRENKLGAAEVRAVFPLGKEHKVAGCMVTEGLIKRAAKARLLRKGQVIHQGPVETLRRFKDDASEVKAGFECGIKLGGYDEYLPGDVIEAVEILSVRPSL